MPKKSWKVIVDTMHKATPTNAEGLAVMGSAMKTKKVSPFGIRQKYSNMRRIK